MFMTFLHSYKPRQIERPLQPSQPSWQVSTIIGERSLWPMIVRRLPDKGGGVPLSPAQTVTWLSRCDGGDGCHGCDDCHIDGDPLSRAQTGGMGPTRIGSHASSPLGGTDEQPCPSMLGGIADARVITHRSCEGVRRPHPAPPRVAAQPSGRSRLKRARQPIVLLLAAFGPRSSAPLATSPAISQLT
jgi:hypothetical protein